MIRADNLAINADEMIETGLFGALDVIEEDIVISAYQLGSQNLL